jgi:Fms-interacting protein/Thoc5
MNMANMPLLFDNDAITKFIDEMDTIESTQPIESGTVLSTAALLLLQIKSSQRNLFKIFHAAIQDRDTKRKHLESKKLVLQNLIYERDHLQQQLNHCHQVPKPYLERMAREEMEEENETTIQSSSFDIINQFLCGSSDLSMLDVQNHKRIMNKLHKELNARGSLQRELEKTKTLKKRKIDFETEKTFLKDIPKKLAAIEKSTLPLQEFFQGKQNKNPKSKYLHLLGTERNKRLDLAKSLPGPLYTMFMTIQAHLDNRGPDPKQSISLHISTRKRTLEESTQVDCHVLHLRFQLGDYLNHTEGKSFNNEKESYVTIEFACSHDNSLVTAKSYGSEDKINHSMLLGCLFPDDTGQWFLRSDMMQGISGKPYHWCNYIAGLIRPTPSTYHTLSMNTNAAMRVLEQRIRTNSVLVQLLSDMEKKKKPPAHPSFVETLERSECILIDWKKQNAISRTMDKNSTFLAILQNRKGNKLYANVSIDWYAYPTTRPSWKLQLEHPDVLSQNTSTSVTTLSEGTNPLYSKQMSYLESQIQYEDLDSLVDKADPDTFHWILSHQLLYLMQLWEHVETKVPTVMTSSMSKGGGGGGNAVGSRIKRGRDRARLV